MNNGWIKLHRAMLNWEWWDDHNTTRLFLYCLLEANHRDKKWRGTLVSRGTFLTGREKLSVETGISQRSIRTSLNKLKSTGEITTVSTSRGTVLSICKYDTYQVDDCENDQPIDQRVDQPPTSHRPATDQQTTTTKNDKNIRREELPPRTTRGSHEPQEIEGIDFIWSCTQTTRRKKIKGAHLRNFLSFWNQWSAPDGDQVKAMEVWLRIGWKDKRHENATEWNRQLLGEILTAAEAYNAKPGNKQAPIRWLKGERWKPRDIITDLHRQIILIFQGEVKSDYRDAAEMQAWAKIDSLVTEEDIEVVAWFYSLKKSKDNGPTWTRKSTPTILMNNWATQVGLAKEMKAKADKRSVAESTPTSIAPEGWEAERDLWCDEMEADGVNASVVAEIRSKEKFYDLSIHGRNEIINRIKIKIN